MKKEQDREEGSNLSFPARCLRSGIEFGRSKTGKGSSGGRKKGVVCGVGQERLGPSYFSISLALVPLNSLFWYERTFLKV